MSEIETLRQELAEARRQQTALAEALEAVALSTYDRDEMLRRLLRAAAGLCDADIAGISLVEGDELVGAITLSGDPNDEAFMRGLRFPLSDASTLNVRSLLSREILQNPDTFGSMQGYTAGRDHFKFKAILSVPMMRDGAGVGVFNLCRSRTGVFSDAEVALVRSFAAQAVIAITNARHVKELEGQRAEMAAAFDREAVSAEVMRAINRSQIDLPSVLDQLTRSAVRLSGLDMGGLSVREGDFMIPHVGAQMEAATADFLRANPIPLKAATILARAALTGESLEVEDFEEPIEKTYRDRFGYRALLHTPMMAEGDCIGVLSIARREAGPFAQRQKDIIRSFAEQAAIAIRNLRLFKDLEARTAELNEALERQTATAETLKTLSRSAFDLDAVLDTLTQSAQALCGADTSGLVVRIDGEYRMRASNGMPPELEAILRKRVFAPSRDSIIPRVLLSGQVEIVPDAEEDPEFVYADKRFPRSVLGVPLIRDGDILGGLVLGKFKAGGFTERQIELLKTYADQAVIAIGNVNLFKDLESRTAELNQALEQQTATAETLKTLSRSVFDLDAVLNTLVESAVALFHATSGGLALLTDGEYKMRSHIGYGPNAQKFFRESAYRPGRDKIVGRVLLSREVEMIRDTRIDHELMKFADPGHDARSMLGVPLFRDGDLIGVMVLRRKEAGGDFSEREIGMVKTFADQAVIAIGNAQLFKDLEARTAELARSLQELRATQHRLIQTEKLASLGQLTAGVAHEIKNPLNFVNNFSKLSVELLGELGEALQSAELPQSLKDEVKDLSRALADNMGKIHHHGQRADSIVKNMLLHARQDGGERRAIDLNALIEESLNLAYHGARVERRDFTIELLRDLDPAVGQLVVCPQELTRVLLNLFSNGFYAAFARAGESGFTPSLRVSTKCHENRIEIRVRDNGNGIPEAIREKLFTPFFTTKPAGEGTGLGLSLSHDIILKQHGGALSFESEAGLFTEFLITLPRDVNEARRP